MIRHGADQVGSLFFANWAGSQKTEEPLKTFLKKHLNILNFKFRDA